jgi:plasmid stabilization system protein ParE
VSIANASNQIRLRSPQKSANFLAEVDAAIDKIEVQPRAYAIRYRNVRRINLASFPYALVFRVEEKLDPQTNQNVEDIVVLLCLHQRQDLESALNP